MVEHEKVKIKKKAQIELKNLLKDLHKECSPSIHRTDAVRVYSILSSYKQMLFYEKSTKKFKNYETN